MTFIGPERPRMQSNVIMTAVVELLSFRGDHVERGTKMTPLNKINYKPATGSMRRCWKVLREMPRGH